MSECFFLVPAHLVILDKGLLNRLLLFPKDQSMCFWQTTYALASVYWLCTCNAFIYIVPVSRSWPVCMLAHVQVM